MSVLDNALGHFGVNSEMRSLVVPEWDTEIFWRPSNLKEQALIAKAWEDEGVGALADILILRALDADGAKVFKKAEKIDLQTAVDPSVMLRIIEAMADEPSDEDIEKK